MRIRPLGNRVLVKVRDFTETYGGIVLPDQMKDKVQRGTIVRCGPGQFRMFDRLGYGKEFWPMEVKEGDEVLYAHYAGTDYERSLGDSIGEIRELKGHKLIDVKDLICVLEPDEPAKSKK